MTLAMTLPLYNAVQKFIAAARRHLTDVRKLVITKETHYSDQCASQYKSQCQNVFYTLSQANVPTQHEYFCPGHGKSLMDGEGAVVKSHVTNAVSH